jgi:hypothetical protein
LEENKGPTMRWSRKQPLKEIIELEDDILGALFSNFGKFLFWNLKKINKNTRV